MENLPVPRTIPSPDTSDASLKEHSGFAGFELIEFLFDGAEQLSPANNAKRSIFLTDPKKEDQRNDLYALLSEFSELLNSAEDLNGLMETCERKIDEYETLINKNLSGAIQQFHNLERSYRNACLFFSNAGAESISNISFLNAGTEQLADREHPVYCNAVKEELNMHYDRLDLRNNYSILIIPGYLGSGQSIENWAKIVHDHKVLLVTDFANLDDPDGVMEFFETANLTGGDVYRSNVIMSCNWLVLRGKYDHLHEEEDLFVPPSATLAGRIYRTLMSQVAAGKKFGILQGVYGVKFELKKNEIANLERLGLIPFVKENGNVIAHAARTLFNGDNLGLQTYSVVRVFDYVSKVLIDFLNRRAFENFNASTRKDLMAEIVKFFDSITGAGKLIEDFTIKRFEQDSVQKDKIYVDIHMKPYFPAKNFMIKMEGQHAEETTSWTTSYNQ